MSPLPADLLSDGVHPDVHRMARLVSALQELSLVRDISGVMGVVRRAARELTNADGASFILRENDHCYYADEDAIAPLWKGKRFPMDRCVSGWAMQHRQAVVIEDVSFVPKRVPIGGKVTVSFVVRSKSREPQDLLVDLAVHFVKARGNSSKKVFKLKRVLLPARGAVELRNTISLEVHTTRTPQPGNHAVDALVNGASFNLGSFDVIAATRRQVS